MDTTKLRRFNIEEAKAGKPVINGAGQDVRIICYDASGDCPIITLEYHEGKEYPQRYTLKGNYLGVSKPEYNLYMKPQIKKGWIASWDSLDGQRSVSAKVYETLEKCKYEWDCFGEITYHEIEWEE